MPRCLCESVDEITLLLNLRTGSWVIQRFLEKTISLACFEGSGLNDIFHLKAQLDIRFRSSLSIAEYFYIRLDSFRYVINRNKKK